MITGTLITEPQTLIIKTSFDNFGTEVMNNLINSIGTIDKQVVQLLDKAELWNNDQEQRLMTCEEWNRAVALWNELQKVPFIEQIRETDMTWTLRNGEYLIDKLHHHGMFELMNGDIEDYEDGYIDFYFRNGDNIELSCTISPYTSEDSKEPIMHLSPYVNIAVNGLNLDYEYECYHMTQPRFIIVFE